VRLVACLTTLDTTQIAEELLKLVVIMKLAAGDV